MAQNPVGAPVTAYNDNSIPFGGIGVTSPVHFFRGQIGPTDLGVFLVETMSTKRPTRKTQRPDQLGGPNGFSLVKGQVGANAKVQLPTAATGFLQEGDYFTYTLDATIGSERWVIESLDQSFEAGGYWFQNVTLIKASYT